MANTLGIAETTVADLAKLSANVNGIHTTVDGLAVSPTNPVIRSRALQAATVRATDHPANDVAEVGDDTDKMALFVSDSLHNVWRLGGSSLGNAHKYTDLTSGDVIAPV